MNNALKGAFLSGLIFPGLGQVVLKHYKRGIVIMLTVQVSMTIVIIVAVQKAFTIFRIIESGGGAVDMNTISNAVTQASKTSGSFIFNFAWILMTFCWIFGIVDAFRIGKKKDIEQLSANQISNSKVD